jgi:hypothetical protein
MGRPGQERAASPTAATNVPQDGNGVVDRRRRVRKAFGTGTEPNGRVNHLAGENGETESPAPKSRKPDGSPRSRSEPLRNRESAPTVTVAIRCHNAHKKTPAAGTTGTCVNHSRHRIP